MPVVGSYRKANWKLIVNNYRAPPERVDSVALYDLRQDLSEKSNLIITQPEKAAALLTEYRQYLANRELKSTASKPQEKRQSKQKN